MAQVYVCELHWEEIHMLYSQRYRSAMSAKDIEVQCFRFIVLGLLSKKISWDVFYLKYLTGVWFYTWVAATIANSYQEYGKYTLSCINYTFSSKMWFNYSAWPFCWYIYKVLVSWIILCSLRKDCDSDITYYFPLSVCNLFIG